MTTLAELKAALTDPAYYRQVGGGLLDAYNRGAVGGLLGTPVDMANGVLNAGKMAAGYIGNQTGLLSGDQMPQPDMMPVGGSEWIGQKMQDAGMVSPNRNMSAEMLAGLAGIPLTAMAAAKAGPMVEKGIGQAMANAQMPSTLNLPQYSGQRGAVSGSQGVRLISSQKYLDEARVAEKMKTRDFDVKISPPFSVDGETFQAIQDGHHALAAAKRSGVSPNFITQTATDNDRIGLLNIGKIDDYLNASYQDSPWYYMDNGRDVW